MVDNNEEGKSWNRLPDGDTRLVNRNSAAKIGVIS